MSQHSIPPVSQLSDGQFITINGPDGLSVGYQYNAETNTLYAKESQIIIPSMHGLTHVTSDPVPVATTDTHGHMSADDKAKLDAITQTRLGVLGFAGSGFPDDGGYLSGDIILAAGTEYISIERVGNVIRFTLDLPTQMCACEECAQIFWIQDESDVNSIRPPSCNGKMPGVNAYGELKIHLLPESTILNPANPLPTLNQKVNVPGLVFKRYDNSITPGAASFEAVLTRTESGTTDVGWAMTPGSTGIPELAFFMGKDDDGNQVRFDFLPESEPDLLGAILYKGHTLTRQMAVVTAYTENVLSTNLYECRFWDILGGQPIGDEFNATNVWRYNNPENTTTQLVDPRALVLDATKDVLPVGTLVSIWEFQIGEVGGERQVRRFFSKDPGLNAEVLWGYADSVRFGDLLTARAEVNPGTDGEQVAAETSVSDVRLFEHDQWGITGFEDPLLLADDSTGTNPSEEELDSGVVNGLEGHNTAYADPNSTIVVSESTTSPTALFTALEFIGKYLKFTSGVLTGESFEIITNDTNTITVFGEVDNEDSSLAAVGDTFVIYGVLETGEPSGVPINNQYVADVDPTIPGLKVVQTDPQSDSERPVYLWHRQNHGNFYVKALIGQPEGNRFPPIDILLRAPVDSFNDRFVKVVSRGQFTAGAFSGKHYIVVKSAFWGDLPRRGVLRSLSGFSRNEIWKYDYKVVHSSSDDDATILVSEDNVPYLFDEDFGLGSGGTVGGNSTDTPARTQMAQLLHQEYNCPALRLEFSVTDETDAESVQMQFRAGILDMTQPYELDVTAGRLDDLVRGFTPGEFTESRVFTQAGFITSIETPEADPEEFRVYRGGFLPVTVDGETERFNTLELMFRGNQLWVWWNNLIVSPDPIVSSSLPTPVVVSSPYFPIEWDIPVGKVAFRLWPGAVVRQVEIRDQLFQFNEFAHGQLRLST